MKRAQSIALRLIALLAALTLASGCSYCRDRDWRDWDWDRDQKCDPKDPKCPSKTYPRNPKDSGTQDPGKGSTDPGKGSTDPGKGSTDPGKGGTDPGTPGNGCPGKGSTDPGNGSTDPGKGGTDPGKGSANPPKDKLGCFQSCYDAGGDKASCVAKCDPSNPPSTGNGSSEPPIDRDAYESCWSSCKQSGAVDCVCKSRCQSSARAAWVAQCWEACAGKEDVAVCKKKCSG